MSTEQYPLIKRKKKLASLLLKENDLLFLARKLILKQSGTHGDGMCGGSIVGLLPLEREGQFGDIKVSFFLLLHYFYPLFNWEMFIVYKAYLSFYCIFFKYSFLLFFVVSSFNYLYFYIFII